MREEPGERVFDIPANPAPAHPAAPKTPSGAKCAAPPADCRSPRSAEASGHSRACHRQWKLVAFSGRELQRQLPPMYRAFLELCGGTLEGDQVTVFAPDEITLNRLDNDRVRGVLSAEAEKSSGQPVRVLFRVGEAPKASPQENLKSLLEFGSRFDNIEIK